MLFNNADGNYEASYKPNVLLYNSDTVPNIHWIPPAIYKSSCTIDVEYFPFDEQVCQMRFGSWTFDAQQVVLKLEKPSVNLQDYLPSGTWDVIEAPGNETLSKETNRVELVYDFKIRRKTLFYTVNLIIPTVLISFLSVFVFYLPTDEGEKMTLCISILLALVVFLLLVSKILPPTSLVIPLISKYLIFTLMMNIVTILNTVIIINWNYRTPRTHNMPKWVKVVFIDVLPKLLFMKRPESNKKKYPTNKELYDLTDKLQQQESPATNGSAGVGEYANSQTMSRQTSRKVLSRNISLEMNENISMTNTNYMGLNNLSGKYVNQETTMNVNMNIGANHNHTHRQLAKNNDGGCSNNESFDMPTTTNHPTNYQRPKQQQHKNLDKLINRKNQFKSNRNPINAEHKQSSRESAAQYDAALGGSRNRFLTLSGSESIGSSRNQSQAHSNLKNTSPHKQSNTNINSGGGGGGARTKRNKATRRQQFSQSHSLDNEAHTSEDEKPMEFSPEILDAADKITFITNHMKNENDYEEVSPHQLLINHIYLANKFIVCIYGVDCGFYQILYSLRFWS